MSFKILELFGGIGACTKALKNLGVDYIVKDYVEINNYSVKSYNAIHNTNFKAQDITKWDKDIEIDLIMHGSPCQDFSLEGKNAGGDKASGTRSSLLYETIRIVEKIKPKYIIWENVKNVISKKHIHNFNNYLNTLETLGYKSYYKVLNAKDYGIPQNRERIFTVSIRKDIGQFYIFPKKEQLRTTLKDLLEKNISNPDLVSNQIMEKLIVNKNPLGLRNATKKGYLPINLYDSFSVSFPDSKNRRGRVAKGMTSTLMTQKSIAVYDICGFRYLTALEYWRLMGFTDEDYIAASKVVNKNQLYKQAGNSIVVSVLEKILKNLLFDVEKEEINSQTSIFDYI